VGLRTETTDPRSNFTGRRRDPEATIPPTRLLAPKVLTTSHGKTSVAILVPVKCGVACLSHALELARRKGRVQAGPTHERPGDMRLPGDFLSSPSRNRSCGENPSANFYVHGLASRNPPQGQRGRANNSFHIPIANAQRLAHAERLLSLPILCGCSTYTLTCPLRPSRV